MKIFLPALLMMTHLACSEDGKKAGARADRDSAAITGTETISNHLVAAADPITDTLMKLPIIIKSNRYIDSLSNRRHGISFISDTTDGVVFVKAGYNGPERFETYYDFSIDIKTRVIKVLDPAAGDYISLEEYMKNNQ